MANIADKINKIRTAIRGLEVRSSLADGLTAVNGEVETNTTNQNNLKKEFDKLMVTAGNSLGDLNISISEGHDLKILLDQWASDNGDILDIDNRISINSSSITALQNQVEQLVGAPTLTRPKIYEVTTSNWIKNNTTELYEYSLVHDLNLSKENIQVKFYSGNTNILLEYEFVNTNSIKILNTTPEVVTVVMGEFVSVDFYTRPEINSKLEEFLKADGGIITSMGTVDSKTGGLRFRTQPGNEIFEWRLVGSGSGTFRLIPCKEDGTIVNQGMALNKNHFYPADTRGFSIGASDRTLYAAWIGNSSSTNTGYTSLPNGYVLQWVRHTITFNNSSSASGTVSIPIAFSSNNFGGFAACVDNISGAAVYNAALYPKDRSSCSIRAYATNGAVQNGTATFIVWIIGN